MARRMKLARYVRIADQIAELIEGVSDPTSRRATAVAILHHKLPGVSWTGFYMIRRGVLTVDVYQGPVACLTIPEGKGVCWAGIREREPIVVPDVEDYPGHVACDARARSEIVLPIFDRRCRAVGVLDLDSHHPNHFDDEDREGLGSILAILEDAARRCR